MLQAVLGSEQPLIDGVRLASKDGADFLVRKLLPYRELDNVTIGRAKLVHRIDNPLNLGGTYDDCLGTGDRWSVGRTLNNSALQRSEASSRPLLVCQSLTGHAVEPSANVGPIGCIIESTPENDEGLGCRITSSLGIGPASEIAVYLLVMGGINPPEALIRGGFFEGRSSNHVTS